MSKQDKKELRQQIACEWLQENYLNYGSLRHDIVADRLQIRNTNLESLEDGSAYSLEFKGRENWRNLTDKDINTMVCQCVTESGVNISVTEMWTALKSDLVPAVHPLREWLNGLRPWSGEVDWIDIVARQVRVRGNDNEENLIQQPKQLDSTTIPLANTASGEGDDFNDNIDNLCPNQYALGAQGEDKNQQPKQQIINNIPLANTASGEENNTTPSYTNPHNTTPGADALWRECVKKWFVAMVASWMKDEVVNHTVLVLVGRQGIYKTTWLDHLIPPELRAYSSKMPLSGQISKDDRLRLCENGLLNIDELDAICGREMNIVKSLLTSTDVNERAAYGRLKERRVRLASFCASTNNREFLTDVTGNRRWLPFEVESIQNPFYTTLPYEQMYAQAKAYVECGYFAYWFDMDEIEVLEHHNEQFRALENEEDLLSVYFAVPAADSMNSKFLTTAEISEKLVSAGNIKRPMSLSRLGMILGQHGFIASRQGTPARRGWIVYERDSEEINAERKLLSRTRIASTDSIY